MDIFDILGIIFIILGLIGMFSFAMAFVLYNRYEEQKERSKCVIAIVISYLIILFGFFIAIVPKVIEL